MTLVAAIHAAVLLAIMRSLGFGAPAEDPPPMITDIYKEVRPPEDRPPPPEPDVRFRTETQVMPRPDLEQVAFEQDIISLPPPEADFTERPPTGDNTPQPVIEKARPDPRYPLSRPQYSARMIREGNQGNIDLEVYVLPNGRVGDARVVKSTGFEELDLAALAEAKRNWRLLPATRDGVAVAQWHRLRVTFKLNER
ncbi:MAG TPA: energy transducer TonB [Steroidobacteraceae bacterium]